MRINGTKFPIIDSLPSGAMAVSLYAAANNYSSAAYLYIKYQRAEAKGKSLGFVIRCYSGTNYVIENSLEKE